MFLSFPDYEPLILLLRRETEEQLSVYEESESLIKNFKGKDRVIFFGDETIGKTSLLKASFTFLNQNGYIPIYLEGQKIKSFNLEEIKKIISFAFSLQYNPEMVDEFEQEDLNKVYIMIDDFDKCRMNQASKGKLIKTLIKYYDNLILVGNELMTIQEILSDEKTSDDLYSTFKHFEILELNHAKKQALIYKWYNLNRDITVNEEEIWWKVDNASKAINTAMGNRLVPNYPFFVLILLQALETTNAHDLKVSSYGNYFQLIILNTLLEKIGDQSELVLYQNYASEFAYHLFSNKKSSVTKTEFSKFHNYFTAYDKFDLPLISYEKALNTLCNVNIIENVNDEISFRYKYTYYYFVAQYFNINISKEEVRKDVSDICSKLYQSDNANILMFLIQFSHENFVLDEILNNAKSVFINVQPCRLESDIHNLHELVSELPKLYLKNKTIAEIREEENKVLDELEEQGKKIDKILEKEIGEIDDQFIDEGDDEYGTDIFSQLNVSAKSIELLGQILKNNHGRMQGEAKHILLKEVYALGLRTLNVIFQLLNDNVEFLLNHFKKAIQKNASEGNEEKLEKLARKLMFSMCSQISLLFIKKISDSIGSNKLMDKYPRIQEEFDFLSVQLINFLIRLDNIQSFPKKELGTIKGVVEKHTLTNFVLKRIVINHLHRHVVSFQARQTIGQFLGISVETQLQIENNLKKEQEGNS